MIPYVTIINTADRCWTFRLLERLTDGTTPDDEIDDLVEALCWLSDPRSLVPLENILTNRTHSPRIRAAAGSVLRSMNYLVIDFAEEKLRHWWHGDDPVLRKQALMFMGGRRCPDIILEVAADPAHEWQKIALGNMEFFFDLPQHQTITIAALSHADPKVRATAAYILLWDEPIRAEVPLIAATADLIPEVVAQAASTLKFYPSQRTIRCLHGLLTHPVELVRSHAEVSCGSLSSDLLRYLKYRGRETAHRVQTWLRPVWELLAFSEEELRLIEKERVPRQPQETPVEVPLADLLDLLTDPEASPRLREKRLLDNHWTGYDARDRRQLRPILATHPDQSVRQRAAQCFAVWNEVRSLESLTADPDFVVRKNALYWLSQLPPTPGVAELAWDRLHRPDALGVNATQTLATFVHHAKPAEAIPRLVQMASAGEQRENLRVAAVDHLAELGAGTEIERLSGLLHEPPPVTWALHIAILEAITRLGLARPNVRHLQDIDNLHVQVALTGWE